jgi:hypothetical protein
LSDKKVFILLSKNKKVLFSKYWQKLPEVRGLHLPPLGKKEKRRQRFSSTLQSLYNHIHSPYILRPGERNKRNKRNDFLRTSTMLRLSRGLLFVCELLLSSIIHLLFGFYIFSTAVAADVSQTLLGSIRPSYANEETRVRASIHEPREDKAFSGTNSVPPIVLVHGIFGFGKGVCMKPGSPLSRISPLPERVCSCVSHFYLCVFVLLT